MVYKYYSYVQKVAEQRLEISKLNNSIDKLNTRVTDIKSDLDATKSLLKDTEGYSMKIGIAGLAGAGKSTVTNALLKELTTFREASFAAPLKKLCEHYCYGLPYFGNKEEKETEYDVSTLKFKFSHPDIVPRVLFNTLQAYFLDIADNRSTITAREILQYVGTEIFRKYDEMFWVKNIASITDSIVLSDLRFENEFDAVNFTIKVIGGKSEKNNFSTHASEKELPNEWFDLVVENKYCETKEELEGQLNSIVNEITDKLFY